VDLGEQRGSAVAYTDSARALAWLREDLDSVMEEHAMKATIGQFFSALVPLVLTCACVEPSELDFRSHELAVLNSQEQVVVFAPEAQQEQPPMSDGMIYDVDRNPWLVDSDRDDTPDEVELIEGTDPHDPNSHSGVEAIALAFSGSCASSSFRLISYNNGGVCIHTDEQDSKVYTEAANTCRTYHKTGRVCTYEDLAFIYKWSSWDSTYNALGMWIGELISDDNAMTGNVSISYNSSSWLNFEANSHKASVRQYWCCHTPD
jgi:hypothetical protein